jgi:hypothetical protein
MRGRERRCTVEGGRTWEEKNEKGRTVIFHQKRIDVGDLFNHSRTMFELLLRWHRFQMLV